MNSFINKVTFPANTDIPGCGIDRLAERIRGEALFSIIF
jgi:hypothetical protein